MANRNCFEILGLEFDPPEDDIQKIKIAYDDWKKRLEAEQNTTDDVQRRNEIKEELNLSNYIELMINNPRVRQKEADKLKEERIEQLRGYIDLMRGETAGTLQVTRAQIRKVSEKLKLSPNIVETTYIQQDFIIKAPRNKNIIMKTLNEFFMSDNVMNELRKNFMDFQTVPDAHNYPWAASVSNLYELAYNIENRTEPNADSYRHLYAQELSEIFQKEAKRVSAPVPAWHSIKTILNIAQMQIFNSNENRFKYDHSLSIEPLNKFFMDLKAAPDIFKRDPYFADNCIERIQKRLPAVANKYNLAVALYNKVAGLLNDPYESINNPNETFFNVVCGNCQTSVQVRTREAVQYAKCPVCGEYYYTECPNCHKKIPTTSDHCTHCHFSLTITCNNCHTATRLNTNENIYQAKCPVCGESYYIDCPKCGKKMPSSAEKCPNCNFALAEMHKFAEYVDEANELLTEIEKAQRVDVNVELLMNHVVSLAVNARLLKPDDLKLKALEDRIDKATITQKRQKLMNWAQSKLPSLSTVPDKAVADCIEIISVMQKAGIKNYRPALDRLRLIKPKKPLSISTTVKELVSAVKTITPTPSITNKISVNSKSTVDKKPTRSRIDKNIVSQNEDEIKLSCIITWQPANDLGIHYQLVRKVNGVPQNNKDGDVLIEKTDKLEFEDKNIITGILYGYAVFAIRAGTVSEPATCEVTHYSDLEESKFVAKTDEDGYCHFNWTLPSKNCLGVRILRSDSEGNSVVIADRVQSPFVDRSVKSKKQYYYRLQCVYYTAGEPDIVQSNDVDRDRFFNGHDFGYNKWKETRTCKYSDGITVNLTPEAPPVALKNITYRVNNNIVTFNWQSTGDFNVMFREMKSTQLNMTSLRNVVERVDLKNLDTILGSNKVLAQTESRNQTCEFALNDEVCKIAVISATKTLGLICEVVTIANVTACTIDKDRTSIDDGKLKIIVNNPLPANLFKIHYAVNTKNTKGRLYASIDEAKNNRLRFVPAKKYELDKVIIVHSPPQMELYITVIGEYKMSDGSTIYSDPSILIVNNRPKAEIKYWLEWGSSGYFSKTPRAKNCKLMIETNADYTPVLYLAYNKNGGLNIEPGEPSTVIIYTIRESEGGFLGGSLGIPLDNAIWENIASGTVIKLLPIKKDEKHFDVRAVRPETLKVPAK